MTSLVVSLLFLPFFRLLSGPTPQFVSLFMLPLMALFVFFSNKGLTFTSAMASFFKTLGNIVYFHFRISFEVTEILTNIVKKILMKILKKILKKFLMKILTKILQRLIKPSIARGFSLYRNGPTVTPFSIPLR